MSRREILRWDGRDDVLAGCRPARGRPGAVPRRRQGGGAEGGGAFFSVQAESFDDFGCFLPGLRPTSMTMTFSSGPGGSRVEIWEASRVGRHVVVGACGVPSPSVHTMILP